MAYYAMASVKKVKGDGRENHEVEEYSDDSYSDNQDDVSDSGSESSAEPEMVSILHCTKLNVYYTGVLM